MIMHEISAQINALHNLGVLHAKMPFNLFTKLSDHIDSLSDNAEPYNHKLLGHIKEEYSLDNEKDMVSEFIEAMAVSYEQAHPGYSESFEEAAKSNGKYKLYLDTLWVNKQKKYEFNPVHHHAGVLSFVIWVKIPYDLNEEEKYFPTTSLKTESHTSKFCFVYTDILGRIQHAALPVDKTWEGSIIMFPAKLHHCVYPFYTSDDYRISVSGNIRIKTTVS